MLVVEKHITNTLATQTLSKSGVSKMCVQPKKQKQFRLVNIEIQEYINYMIDHMRTSKELELRPNSMQLNFATLNTMCNKLQNYKGADAS